MLHPTKHWTQSSKPNTCADRCETTLFVRAVTFSRKFHRKRTSQRTQCLSPLTAPLTSAGPRVLSESCSTGCRHSGIEHHRFCDFSAPNYCLDCTRSARSILFYPIQSNHTNQHHMRREFICICLCVLHAKVRASCCIASRIVPDVVWCKHISDRVVGAHPVLCFIFEGQARAFSTITCFSGCALCPTVEVSKTLQFQRNRKQTISDIRRVQSTP